MFVPMLDCLNVAIDVGPECPRFCHRMALGATVLVAGTAAITAVSKRIN